MLNLRFPIVFFALAILLVSCSLGNSVAQTPTLAVQTQPLAANTSTQATNLNTTTLPKPTATVEKSTQMPTPKAVSSTKPAGKKDIGNAINLVMGNQDMESVFPSYHIEIDLFVPVLSNDEKKVVNRKTKISADVQGKNIHLFYTSGSDPTQEGYLIGDNEYKMVNGKPKEIIGEVAMTWVAWPLQAWGYYAAAPYSGQTGSETYENIPSDVYSMDTSKYNAESLKTLIGMGMSPITGASGQAWIDHKTGGLLKTKLDYKTDIYDMKAEKVIGPGEGHIEITLSKIGQVSVKQP